MTKQLTYGEAKLQIATITTAAESIVNPKDKLKIHLLLLSINPAIHAGSYDFRTYNLDEQFLELTLPDALKLYTALAEKIEELQSLGVEV